MCEKQHTFFSRKHCWKNVKQVTAMSCLLIHGWEIVLSQIVLFDGEDHLRPCDIQHSTSSSNKWGISSCCQIILADQTSLGLGAVWVAAVRGMLLMERKLLSNLEEKGFWQDNRTMKFRNDGAGETEGEFSKFSFWPLSPEECEGKKKFAFHPPKSGILVAESLSAQWGNAHAILLNSVLGMARNARNVILGAQPSTANTGW